MSGRLRCTGRFERQARERGFRLIAGVDEVGRGCLLGPVCAAAVILSPDRPIRGLADSKTLPAERREALAKRIQERAVAWAVGWGTVTEIDQINILQASRLAMKRAIESLPVCPDYLLVDAVTVDLPMEQTGIIKGDAQCQSIAAASIVAKVVRDAHLRRLGEQYPEYGLDRNKGYGTPDHLKALSEHGPTAEHRRSFMPVQQFVLEFEV